MENQCMVALNQCTVLMGLPVNGERKLTTYNLQLRTYNYLL